MLSKFKIASDKYTILLLLKILVLIKSNNRPLVGHVVIDNFLDIFFKILSK